MIEIATGGGVRITLPAREIDQLLCETCKSWKRDPFTYNGIPSETGVCQNETFHENLRIDIRGGDCWATIEVDSDFGCRFWERRKEG